MGRKEGKGGEMGGMGGERGANGGEWVGGMGGDVGEWGEDLGSKAQCAVGQGVAVPGPPRAPPRNRRARQWWSEARDVLEGKGPQRRLDRRLKEVAVGYKCH